MKKRIFSQFTIILNCLLIIILNLTSINSNCQDTNIYSGLILTQIDDLYRNTNGNDGVNNFYYNTRFSNFLVSTDSNLNYNKDISNGIFLTSYFINNSININYHELKEKRISSFINISDTILRSFFNPNSIYDESIKLPTSKYWKSKNSDNMDVLFYLMYCEFKYILYKEIEFKTANLKSRKKKNAFIKYRIKVYFITELISMKPITKINAKD